MGINVSSEILKYKDEILEDVIKIVGIQSVRNASKPEMPFGEGSTKALLFCLELAKSFGLKVKNIDNRAGYIEYGEGERLIGILAHVDVVPAGEGWSTPPFVGTVKNGRIYGRGTMDDKGPAIAAIYCLKTLKDLNILLKSRVRVILGAAEESGMEDMSYYSEHEEMPDLAFTPDGEYPICNSEKGILQLSLTASNFNSRVLSFKAGSAPNMVPVTAEAVVSCSADEAAGIEKTASLLYCDGIRVAVMPDGEGSYRVRCIGKAAHSSTPEMGRNAAAYLIKLLSLSENAEFFSFLDRNIGTQYDGKAMGIACSDSSGELTLNLGIVYTDTGKAKSVLDIRYPVKVSGGAIFNKIALKAEEYGITTELLADKKPLFIDENNPLISKLKKAYKTVTNKEAKVYSTGGGTYARVLDSRGVAFGAGIMPLSYYNIHSADEFLEIEDFMKHCEICMQAIYELAN